METMRYGCYPCKVDRHVNPVITRGLVDGPFYWFVSLEAHGCANEAVATGRASAARAIDVAFLAASAYRG